MKKLIVLIVFLAIGAVGCATIEVTKDGAKYRRIGDQQLNGVTIEKTAEGDFKATLEGQASTGDALVEAIKKIPTGQ